MSRRLLVLLGCAFAGACADPPDTRRAQLARGEEVYRAQCYACHEVEGSIGVELSSRVLRYYENAGALLAYTRLTMPYSAPGSLSEQEYLDLVAYLVDSRGLAGGFVLTARSADSVILAAPAND